MDEEAEQRQRTVPVRDGFRDVIAQLFDTQLQTIVTTRMAPTLYVVGIAGVFGLNVYLAVLAFQQALWFGLIWLLLIAPVVFLAGVITVRVALEVILSIFRIVVNMEALMEQLHTLRGQTESIAESVEDLPLPRIQFWRRRRSAGENRETAAGEKTDKRAS